MENKRFEEENAELKAENKDRKIQKSFLQERIEHIRKKMIIFWYGFKVQNLLKQSLVCIDFIKKQDVIYIGESENLQDQFVKYVDSNFENDACKQKTNTYQRMFVENQQERKTLHVFQVYPNIDYTLHNFQLHL